MKANFTLSCLFRNVRLLALFFILPLVAFCQPDYDFRNASLIAGTDHQVNAVYLFQNVRPGVDATVTIKDITGGIILSNIDGPSGYVEALQPVLEVPPLASGYVEFEINFLFAGTSTPMVQAEVPATPIDVDGQTYADGIVNEFDVLQLTNGYINYDMLGGELNMNINSSWVTGINTQSIDYPGVDTAPRQVMFTTVNAAISTFTFRTGANSAATASHQRLRSVYFKKFNYPNAFLPVSPLAFFNGAFNNKKIILQWKTSTGHQMRNGTVERAVGQTQFAAVSEERMNPGTGEVYDFVDNNALQGTVYYRLKMTGVNNQVLYSNTLVFHLDEQLKQPFKIYPSLITDQAAVNIASAKTEQVALQLSNTSGYIVYQKKIALQQGTNSIAFNGMGNLQRGIYTATIKTGSTMHSQKIMIH